MKPIACRKNHNLKLFIRVYENGEIVFSSALVKLMDIKCGDSILMFSEFENGFKEIYIAKSDNGALVYKSNRNGYKTINPLRIYSSEYSKILLGKNKKGIFRIGEKINKEGIDYFNVIYVKNYATDD